MLCGCSIGYGSHTGCLKSPVCITQYDTDAFPESDLEERLHARIYLQSGLLRCSTAVGFLFFQPSETTQKSEQCPKLFGFCSTNVASTIPQCPYGPEKLREDIRV
ncbi:hypothetical protein ACLB2K_011696 [Fragaria x ananassa]